MPSTTLISLSVLFASFGGVLATPLNNHIGNTNWTPRFASTGWFSAGNSSANGLDLYYTGQQGCSGIQRVSSTRSSANWKMTDCLSNDGDKGNWGINLNATFAATSIGSSDGLSDLGLFFWTMQNDTAVIKDAYFNHTTAHWISGALSHVVTTPNYAGLAATTWIQDGKVGRTLFYVQGGWLKEMTLVNGGEWANQGREGVQLFYNSGEISAISWIDNKGVLNKRVYVENLDAKQVVEYAWSAATPYTTSSNVFPTTFVESNSSAMAASVTLWHNQPTLYLWTVGAQGGNVVENGNTHGRNAKVGTKLAAAGQESGSAYVFFINQQGYLTESYHDASGRWHENTVITISNH